MNWTQMEINAPAYSYKHMVLHRTLLQPVLIPGASNTTVGHIIQAQKVYFHGVYCTTNVNTQYEAIKATTQCNIVYKGTKSKEWWRSG